MTKEQWIERVKRVLQGLRTEVGVTIVSPKEVILNGTAARIRVNVGGMECTFVYGYDLHEGRADQFWLDIIWDAEYGIESIVFSERDLMDESIKMVHEVMDSLTY